MLQISLSELNIFSIFPMLCNIVGAIFILILDLLCKQCSKIIYIVISIISILASFYVVIDMNLSQTGFFGLIDIDGLSILTQIIILLASFFFLFLIATRQNFVEFAYSEFYALFLFMVAGYQIMVSSNNLMVIFLGLESSSLALYALIALNKRQKALEASLKYFTLGALGSGFFAFGIMFFYASSGSVEIVDIAKPLTITLFSTSSNIYFVLLSFVFLFAALGFKLSFFPFHTWVPDVYEGSYPPLAFYMSIATKIAGFIVALKIFYTFLYFNIPFVNIILFVIVVLTMTIPNVIALLQDDVQRMLAYSSISQAGFGLACLFIDTQQSIMALFLYWILFLFANLGAFGMLWLSYHKDKLWDSRFNSPYSKFSGLIKISPIFAITFAIFMLSLAGIPPFGMFWGKLYIISSSINANHRILALILLFNSAIAVYYYVKLIVFMFLKEPVSQDITPYKQNISVSLIVTLLVAFFVSFFALLWVESFLSIIAMYLYSFD